MYARTSTVQFQPDAKDQALAILQNVIFLHARQQRGFQGAPIVTFWKTEADLERT